MAQKPICFDCIFFKQYQPLHFITPGECKWTPPMPVPEWMEGWLNIDDRYYGPHREVSTHHPVLTCEAFIELVSSEEHEDGEGL